MNTLFIFGAKYLFLVSILVGLIWFWSVKRDNKKKVFIFGSASLIVALAIGKILNLVISSPRPFVVNKFTPLIAHAADNGFPSDHTLLVAAIASIVSIYNKKIGILLWLITLFVAISRVYVGVHHPIDVIGSILIAIFSSTILYFLFRQRRMI